MEDTLRIVRGRTATSQNVLHRGFRYSRDGKVSTKTGKQAWRCVLRSCKGRLFTLRDDLDSLTQEHNHGPDLADCEVKATLSAMKDIATTSRTSNQVIYASTTGALSQSTRCQMPSISACKKQAQRARRTADPRPRAPASLDDIELEGDDCTTTKATPRA